MRLAFLLPALLSAGCAGAARLEPYSSGKGLHGQTTMGISSAPLQEEVYIHLDTGRHRLTAYQIAIYYNPAVVRIASIRRGPHVTFPAIPEFDPASFDQGMTRVLASRLIPAGPGYLHLLTVTFARVGPGESAVDVMIESLYDHNVRRVPGRLMVWPDRIQWP